MDAERLDDQCSYSWYSLFAIRRDHRTTAFVRIFMGRPAGSRVPPPRFHHHLARYIKYSTFSRTMSVSAVVSHVARRARGRAVSLARLFSTAEFDSVSSSVSAHSPVGGASGGLGHGHGHAGRTQGDRGSFASGSRGFGRRFATNSHGTYTSVLSVLSVLSLAHSLTHSLAPTSHQTS